ncbi:hypothetical protein [Pseudomonas sp. SO81]|uniref:hypothetical protein n=1 Tax=Pseudomonas sp. SO81 TaxID=2983246 RepID=UPI0025A3B4F1|nr:hypothetical protein [Pseudomonas sp. SO81]WJN60941.1 hypothetical protein OH686_19525 [Pseudomonas sp. SO81]
MSRRILTWPWHGRLRDGLITLADGSLRAHPMPPNDVGESSGPGDTHLIEVAGIPAITAEEVAQAPAGGQWWAGRALLSGTDLYGKRLDGWIYQAVSGSKWWLRLQNITVGTSSTALQIRSRRFGVAGGEPEERLQSFTLPAGRATGSEAARVFADLRTAANGVLRLHAVSPTGRHAVLALVTYQNAGSGALDRRPRAYRFFLATVTGEGGALTVSISLLYGIDDIAPPAESASPSGFVRLAFEDPVEVSRVPVFSGGGSLVAYDVTYSLDSAVTLEASPSSTPYTKPGTYSGARQLMVQVGFDGETPVPVRARVESVCEVPAPELERVTIESRIVREFLSGSNNVLQTGRIAIQGETVVTTVARLECGAWSDDVTITTTSTVDTGEYAYGAPLPSAAVSNSYSLAGTSGGLTLVQAGLALENMQPVSSAVLQGDGATRQPLCVASIGEVGLLPSPISYRVALDLYSNNLVGISCKVGSGPQVYVGAAVRTAFLPMAGDAAPAVNNYGSFNPKTEQAVIGSISPVNWI